MAKVKWKYLTVLLATLSGLIALLFFMEFLMMEYRSNYVEEGGEYYSHRTMKIPTAVAYVLVRCILGFPWWFFSEKHMY